MFTVQESEPVRELDGDKKPAKPPRNRAAVIGTLADLNRRTAPDSDSDSDGPQEYYTGGEKSGMRVQDSSKK